MDFELNEEQQMLQRTVREFMTAECSRVVVREIENTRQDYSPEMWAKMADLGFCGLMIPEEYGGQGLGWLEMAVFYEEVGRALCPSPHYASVLLSGQTILALGSDAQKQALLPKIASGEEIVVCALEDAVGVETTAAAQGDNYVINGTKLFASFAHLADHIIVRASVGGQDTLLIVDKGADGLSTTPMDTMGGERSVEVQLNNVTVPAANVLGGVGGGGAIDEIEDRCKVMLCVAAAGAAEVDLDMLVEYSKNRIQFGVPIGSFQHLQFRMAEDWVFNDGAKWLAYETAWKLSEGIDTPADRAMAQIHCSKYYVHTSHEVVQMHGGLGIMKDYDAGLFYDRAKAFELYMGVTADKQEVIAQELLDS
jgi:alkylation response protein AidB-like acyl-CoA dehydrogenase